MTAKKRVSVKTEQKQPLDLLQHPPILSNAWLFTVIRHLQAVHTALPAGTPLQAENTKTLAITEQLLSIRLTAAALPRSGGRKPGDGARIYIGTDEEEGSRFLRGAAEIAVFLNRSSVGSVHVALSRANHVLDNVVTRHGRRVVRAVRPASAEELRRYAELTANGAAYEPPAPVVKEAIIASRRTSNESPKERRLRLEKEGKEDI